MLPLNKLREITLSSNIREVSLRACRCVRMIRLFKRSALTLLCRVARQFQGNWTVNTASRRDWTPWPIRQELISICYHWLADVACHGEILTSNFMMNVVLIILILNWWYFLTGDMPIRHDFVGRQRNKRVKGGWWCPRTWIPAAVKFYLKKYLIEITLLWWQERCYFVLVVRVCWIGEWNEQCVVVLVERRGGRDTEQKIVLAADFRYVK